jgi:hypothetical protein
MKARLGMLERNYDATVDTTHIAERVKKPEHIALIQEMADQSMTLVDNKLGIVPIDMSKKIAYVAYNAKRIPMLREYGDIEGLSGYNPETGMVDSTTLMYQHLLKEAMRRGGDKAKRQEGDVHYFALDKKSSKKDIAAVEKQLSDYDVVILACHDPRGRSRKDLIAEEHVNVLEGIVKKYHPLLVHYGSPYGLSNLPWKEHLGGLLVAYKDSESNQKAAAKILTGEIKAVGQLPVTVE